MQVYLDPHESDVEYKYTEEAKNTFETPMVISFRKDKVEG